MTFNDTASTNEQEAANLFYDYFSSVYSTERNNIRVSKLNISTFDLLNVVLGVDDVYHGLSAFHGVGSVGLKGLSGDFLFELGKI